MTPSDWATSTDPHAMLMFLRERRPVGERKLTLLSAACCRRAWDRLVDTRSRQSVEVVEQVADGDAGRDDLSAAREGAILAEVDLMNDHSVPSAVRLDRWLTARAVSFLCSGLSQNPPAEDHLANAFGSVVGWTAYPRAGAEDEVVAGLTAVAALLRDIFGDPFSPTTFLPEWRTEAVLSLSRGIYEDGAWEVMPVLGDALDEAGADPAVVSHCREPGAHVRGCHVLDGVLGRS
jgi:hypothetical protein